ncbi:hypothetical protein DM02DRAFT_618379 [Periconia macrospinosa]|uniref:EthD domain-containing protein n=1 Tax=Periconia macrospinosa TaxID=97972 RepID=A0A2V1D9P1_9PLEO|nr:hypothetical protein DM02DRAFT_618379 [Periconia macrospinosa]
MTHIVIAKVFRKRGTTPTEFRNHYDNVHVPLLKSLTGDTFPLTHTRNYIHRVPATTEHSQSASETTESFPAVQYRGEPEDFAFDSLTVMVWESEEKFEAFVRVFLDEEVQGKIIEDEKLFQDRSKKMSVAIKDAVVTGRE